MSKTQGKTARPSSRPQTRPQPAADHAAKQPEPESPMASLGAAFKNMEDQIREGDGFCEFNLSAMHRACGQPPGSDPWSWIKQAAPVVAAIHQYHGVADPHCLRDQPLRVVLADGEDLGEFASPGDCETLHTEVALMYALYLNRQLPVEFRLAGA